MTYIQTTVGDCRMGPVLVGSLGDGELADRLESVRIGLNEVHCAVFCIDVQHAVGTNDDAGFNCWSVPHDLAGFPIQADKTLVAALGGPIDAAVEEYNAVHLW